MSDEISLTELGIQWTSKPNVWHTIPKKLLPICNVFGELKDVSDNLIFVLKPHKPLGNGTFGRVDSFAYELGNSTKYIAIKRPKHPNIHLLTEALFQWKLHKDLQEYGLSFCIPKVEHIFTFKPTNDVWFSMTMYEPSLLSSWCLKHFKKDGKTFCLLMLQISVILQIVEDILKIDHRDLKVNNILVVDEPKEIQVTMGTVKKRCIFPFYIVFIDFGFACIGDTLDIRTDGLPPIDTCPKEGRDIFQILVSIWRIDTLRSILEEVWGNWFHSKINSAGNYIQLTEKAKDLTWMYAITEDKEFKAPLCTPNSIIKDCFRFLDL